MPPGSSKCRRAPTSWCPTRPGFSRTGAAFSGAVLRGRGRRSCLHEELAHYYDRVAKMAGADMLAWLHR